MEDHSTNSNGNPPSGLCTKKTRVQLFCMHAAFKNTPKQQHLNFDECSRALAKIKRRNLHAWHAADISKAPIRRRIKRQNAA